MYSFLYNYLLLYLDIQYVFINYFSLIAISILNDTYSCIFHY